MTAVGFILSFIICMAFAVLGLLIAGIYCRIPKKISDALLRFASGCILRSNSCGYGHGRLFIGGGKQFYRSFA